MSLTLVHPQVFTATLTVFLALCSAHPHEARQARQVTGPLPDPGLCQCTDPFADTVGISADSEALCAEYGKCYVRADAGCSDLEQSASGGR